MLLEEFDRETNVIIDPNMCAERIEDFPAVTISCFSWKLFDSVLATFDARKIADLHSATGLNPVYEAEYKGKRFALYHSLVGEPICVAQHEDLMAMGSKRLILLDKGALTTGVQAFPAAVSGAADAGVLDGLGTFLPAMARRKKLFSAP